jgi:glycerol-3-phosphate acyltransferase PlsX
LKIALDALGGDDAPRVTVAGALLALNQAAEAGIPDLEIVLIGDNRALKHVLPKSLPPGLSIYHVAGNTGQHKENYGGDGENPNSPIRMAMRLHNLGQFDAVVSAGSTTAQVLASMLELEKCHGITRPAIGSVMPTINGYCFMLDLGASLVATPHHLVQFAAMGLVYTREVLNITEPRIGLLNVGTEEDVGERAVVEAYRLLKDSGFNFVGFIEGRDIIKDKADVIVTNGFVGNVLLKFAESLPGLIRSFLPPELDRALLRLPAFWR